MLQLKPFRQRIGFCGPATLKMVLHYYGIKKKEAEIAEATKATPEIGVEADQLISYAQSLGLNAYYQDNASFDDLRRLVHDQRIPVIVDWFSQDDGHYSAVVDIDDENIYLLDPEIGHVRAMRLGRFYRVWFDFPGDFIVTNTDVIVRRMIVIQPEQTVDGHN